MNREIFIGGEKIQLPCCSIHRHGNSGVSDNSVVYNFDCKIMNVEIHIFKDSEEGIKFKEWIEDKNNQNRQSVEHMAIKLLLPLMNVEDFFGIIDKEKNSSWNAGYRKAQYDIRRALGL